MKFILLHSYLIILLVGIPIISNAQEVVDTSSPEDPLIAPTIVVNPTYVEPDCHTYTGCDVMVVKRYHPTHHYKHKRHRIYHRPC